MVVKLATLTDRSSRLMSSQREDVHCQKIALVGVGKIARDQHIPALARHPAFELAAAVSLDECAMAVPTFRSVEEMARAMPEVQAVSICTPPDCRLEIVAQALAANLHVMLEKPTAATVAKAMAMEAMARGRTETLFASWHSRHAAGVAALKQWIKGQSISQIKVIWREDIRVWHPGQEWIFTSGYGVFDPAINAFSILTEVLDETFFFAKGDIFVPENKGAPISADLRYRFPDRDGGIHLELDFDYRGASPEWSMLITCENGLQAKLENGGALLTLPTDFDPPDDRGEYYSLYSTFADLIARKASDFDLSPMFHVFDAMALSHRHMGKTFDW